jgi:hypothetical protein
VLEQHRRVDQFDVDPAALDGLDRIGDFGRRRPHHHRHIARVVIRTPVPSADAMWPVDYNIVPRYRYRPQDDRVDPYGPPVARGEPEPGGLGIGQ